MKKAYVAIRDQPVYRRGAFVSGLKAVGCEVRIGIPQKFDSDTVFCCWNRYGANHEICTQVERAGGVCLIAENGYLAEHGESPHGMSVRTVYALGVGYHNDASAIPEGGPERWRALGVDLAPWRESGGHVLVAPNRSFGVPGRMMPPNWPNDVCQRLRRLTKREVRLRAHPGNSPAKKPLVDDLSGAWATVIWSSSAGVHSLIHGVPVICCAPAWICKGAADSHLECVEKVDDRGGLQTREEAMRRLAWGQWHIDEIVTGEPFKKLLTPNK